MVTVQSSGSGIAFRTIEPKRFRQIAGIPGVLTHIDRKTDLTEDTISPEEYRELRVLDEFLTHHIQTDGLRNVQCMLLWSEWVRAFQRTTHKFPKVILEKQFREVITSHLGIDIAHDDYRGAVYPGIRFVP